MKIGVALSVATLVLLGSSSVQAQTLPLTLTLTPTALGNNVFAYGGEIHNTTNDPVLINDLGFTLPADVKFTDVLGDLDLGDLPLTLTKGGDFTSNDFFELTIPAGEPAFTANYRLTSNGVIVGSADFRIGGAAVPEPGSVALLMSGLIGGGAFMLRRRK